VEAGVNTSYWEAYIRARVRVDPVTGCWNWTQGCDPDGYGRTTHAYNHGLDQEAHRVSYRVFKGPIPEGKQVRHQCHNRPCCNPEHILLGTHQDNIDDGKRDGRVLNGQTKLTHAQVKCIRKLLATRTLTQRAIAAQFGVSPSSITFIKQGKHWAHA
jgi:hypothetical protein